MFGRGIFGVCLATLAWQNPAQAESQGAAQANRAPVVVPFVLYSGHIYVDVDINGQGPFQFIFDTGALNILSPVAAERLGLKPKGAVEARGSGGTQTAGMAKVDTVRIGATTLKDQRFYILDLPPTASEGRTVDGLVGFEWLSQFPTRVDYIASTLTFYPAKGLDYRGPAAPTKLWFRGRTAQIDASVDGLAGRFTVDTGSNGSLILYPDFAAKNGLVARYNAGTEVLSAVGVGGPVYALQTRVGEFAMAGKVVARPITYLPQARAGTSADRDTAGRMGFGVLRRFTIIFDYPGARAFFEPNATLGDADIADRSGLRADLAANGFKILFVVKGSAAALAGLEPGDVIASVNGISASGMDLAAFRALLKDEVGTRIAIGLHGGRATELTLREID